MQIPLSTQQKFSDEITKLYMYTFNNRFVVLSYRNILKNLAEK